MKSKANLPQFHIALNDIAIAIRNSILVSQLYLIAHFHLTDMQIHKFAQKINARKAIVASFIYT